MTVAVSTLISRVRDLVNEHRHWFEAVSAWYDCAKWTKKIFVNYLAARNKPAGRAVLSINDRTQDDRFLDPKASAATPLWWIPASTLRAGQNHIALMIEESKSTITLDGINVEHVPELTDRTKLDLRPSPKASAQMAIAVSLGTGWRPESDRWTVEAQSQAVRFTLHFDSSVPRDFLLGFAVKLPTIGYSLILEDIWDFVRDTIKKKIKQLLKEYYRRLQANDPQAEYIEAQLRDLRSYLELHESHLAHALVADDEMTLEEIIARSRKPARVVTPEPITVKPVESPPPVQPAQPPKLPREAPRPRASSGMGCIGRILLVGVLLAVTAGAVLASAWMVGLINLDRFADIANLPNGDARQRELEDLLRVKGAKSGDVQISLQWFNKNDLDLEVVPPNEDKLFYNRRESPSGGKLDIDMNIAYETASNRAVENVFWPVGRAPKGRYKVYVVHFNNHQRPDTQDPTRYSVRILVRGQPRWLHGEITYDGKKQPKLIHEFDLD